MKIKVISIILVVTLLVACLSMNAYAVILTQDDYGSYSGSVTGINGIVNGEYRARYGSNILDRYVINITGHIGSVTSNKVVSIGAYESSSGKTRYIAVDTMKWSDGSPITALSQPNSSTAWNSITNNDAEWYKTKSGITGSLTVYATYECKYSSTLSYYGYPNLFNVN